MYGFYITSILLLVCYAFSIYAQIQSPQAPTFGTFQNVTGLNYPSHPNMYQQRNSSHSIGAHANDVIEQQYQISQQYLGMCIDRPYLTPAQNQQARINFLKQKAIGSQYLPGAKGGFAQQVGMQREVINILNEVQQAEHDKRRNSNYYYSAEFTTKTKLYTDALRKLNDMLSGRSKLSIKEAYFTIEQAYGNSYLTRDEYDKAVTESSEFIKEWLRQNGYELKDNTALHYGIQQFMSDTLSIKVPLKDDAAKTYTKVHFPFSYDYKDFKGEMDYRNYFSTKCLATGYGQCNSLPAVYNILAESLGAKSYLSLAPNHSFIKYPDNKGNIHGYEPTSNWQISDRWYEEHLFISAEAKRNRIYLDTLNYEQIVANCMLDLAVGYMDKFGVADGEFIRECAQTAFPYFPGGKNVQVYMLYSSVLARQLERVMYASNITTLEGIKQVPEAMQLYQALVLNEKMITQLGYQDIPSQLYEQLMQQQEFKGNEQKKTAS